MKLAWAALVALRGQGKAVTVWAGHGAARQGGAVTVWAWCGVAGQGGHGLAWRGLAWLGGLGLSGFGGARRVRAVNNRKETQNGTN